MDSAPLKCLGELRREVGVLVIPLIGANLSNYLPKPKSVMALAWNFLKSLDNLRIILWSNMQTVD